MKLSRLVKQLKKDEGVRHKVYLDSLGLKTVGVGHLIKEDDPDWLVNLGVGDSITDNQVNNLLMEDIGIAIQDAMIIFEPVWDTFPHLAQEIFINMIFNMGRTRFLGFKKTIAAAYEKDWLTVSTEMLDSKWATQVGNRANRLSANMRAIHNADFDI